MPIKGLTTTTGRLPEIGQLRKGAPKPERGPGRDLPHFRFTSEYPNLIERFHEKYGAEPRYIANVFSPNALPDDAFAVWREEWVAGGLKHRCDGEWCTVWQSDKGEYHTSAQETGNAKKCPGGCKPVGRLSLILPDLGHLATVCVLTSSVHDIMRIQEQLTALYVLHGSLHGIPLVLRRSPHKISVPGEKGRVRMAKSLLSIEAMPSFFELKLAELEADSRPKVPLLPEGRTPVAPAVVHASAPARDFGAEPDAEEPDAEFREMEDELDLADFEAAERMEERAGKRDERPAGEVLAPVGQSSEPLSDEPQPVPSRGNAGPAAGSRPTPPSPESQATLSGTPEPELPTAREQHEYGLLCKRAYALGAIADQAPYEATSTTPRVDLARLREQLEMAILKLATR